MPELAQQRRTPAPQSPPQLAPLGAANALARAWALVGDDLQAAEACLGELLSSPIASIPRVGGHLAFSGGKRLRPLMTLLAAQAAGYDDEERITAAAVGELVHNATLLHDDVIDNGEFRRGRPAARMVFGENLTRNRQVGGRRARHGRSGRAAGGKQGGTDKNSRLARDDDPHN